jgi:hypothetical protein
MKDWRGNAIEVGSTIVYPQASSYACVNEGVIDEILSFQEDGYNYVTGERGPHTRYKLRVRRTWESQRRGPEKVEGKTVTIDRIDRITVVPAR